MPRSMLATAPMAGQTDDMSVDDLWSAYAETGSLEDRDRLVLHYTGLVTYVASRLGAPMPASVDYSDLIQSGIIGLMDAVARFEPQRGLKFETFAVPRIRGAILDSLRADDWVPRSVRRRARDLDAATESCLSRLRRTPSAAELADELEVSVDDLGAALALTSRTHVGAIDEIRTCGSGGEKLSIAETLADPFAERPGDALERQSELEALWAAIGELAERDRAVLVHSYIDGLTLAQIGRILGVTESRVCQLRGRALRELATLLVPRLAV